jgi:hypothetical protein
METLEQLQGDLTALSIQMYVESSLLVGSTITIALILVMGTLERWLVCVPFS